MLRAAARLRRLWGPGLRVSQPWRTPPWPPGAGGADFVNAVAVLPRLVPPERALAQLHGIEAAMGRVRRERWGARLIDLDLVAAGRLVRPDAAAQARWRRLDGARRRAVPGGLVLPHPRLGERAFVLLPLAEVAPRWRDPVTGRTARALAAALPLAERLHLAPLGPARPVRRRGPVKPPLANRRLGP
ncbi:2-amino-4-hydroxy-6-hydroxymethyldihydropteridine diphosphokinase [Jannaschia sp. W003]|uniref:2-amino-4-hydroxy-6- hydroxymethyldihydropteridine diphosphokinase n=1 Tax=Jannaschia sp. W003 TaxID=2867012 RepID=UPI0021A2D9C5|nr:2-amino-4-hydroxy-6-hydroxymethyldihydropteridine diphosphokinase [Jannaschia sp. W003]